ncbi:hypothetical protein BKA70DRAFT_1440720 [Coprinopsis sp. MPI-PUGE-AT-0042]|nr:hypothetical protein BKA70DRAFT_1440720 [Coprinopsis sp. MPI-PUGE-AT-0042]
MNIRSGGRFPGDDDLGDDGDDPRYYGEPYGHGGRGRAPFRGSPRRAPMVRYLEYYDEQPYWPGTRAPYEGKPIIAPVALKPYSGDTPDLKKYTTFRTDAATYCRRGEVRPDARVGPNPQQWDFTSIMDGVFDYTFPKTFLAVKMDTVGIRDPLDRIHCLWNGFSPRVQAALWNKDLDPSFSDWDVVAAAEAVEHLSHPGQPSMKLGYLVTLAQLHA